MYASGDNVTMWVTFIKVRNGQERFNHIVKCSGVFDPVNNLSVDYIGLQ